MRILVVHNAYQQRGGEDSAVAAEIELLRNRGHEVRLHGRHNDELRTMPVLAAAADTLWSRRTVRDMAAAMSDFAPQVIHAHNTFPLISPSLYWAAANARVPVVQTLHNFRLLCPQGIFLRRGGVCEDCLGGVPWAAIRHRCYRDSLPQTLALSTMLVSHRALGTYRSKVTRYIALNEFCRRRFIQGGLPAEKIVTKPNFAPDSALATSPRRGGLFVGRLAPEKGVDILLGALEIQPGYGVDIVGSGPLADAVAAHRSTRCLGWLDRDGVSSRMAAAAYLLMPSICYESFSMVIVEAFASGLPVIASRLGTMAEIVEHERTGLLFEPGSAAALAAAIRWAEANPDAMRAMGQNARREYESKYTPETNYRQLMAIYADALAACHSEEDVR